MRNGPPKEVVEPAQSPLGEKTRQEKPATETFPEKRREDNLPQTIQEAKVDWRPVEEDNQRLEELRALTQVSLSDMEASLQNVEAVLDSAAKAGNRQGVILIARLVKIVKKVGENPKAFFWN